MVLDEDTEIGDISVVTPAANPKANASNGFKSDVDADPATETAEGTPDPSAANARRGLRNRKPAQQRPYYHDAQLFEDAESSSTEGSSELSVLSREPSIDPGIDQEMANFPGMALWDALANEAVELYKQQNPEKDERQLQNDRHEPAKTKHFKGKGRAWKKEGSDEDEEFTPKQKKAAKAKAEKAKAKADKTTVDDTPKPKKKIGRPRKSIPSEDIVRDKSDNDTSLLSSSPRPHPPPQPTIRGRGRPRKSALSAEIVRDDSDDSARAPAQPSPPPNAKHPAPAPAPTPKKRGRPRKSDSTTAPAKPWNPADDTYIRQRQRAASPGESKPVTARASTADPPPGSNDVAALVAGWFPKEVPPKLTPAVVAQWDSNPPGGEGRREGDGSGNGNGNGGVRVEEGEGEEDRELSASMSLGSSSDGEL